MDFLLPASVFLPMLAAPVSYIIGRKNKNARNLFAMAVQALILFPTLWLLVRALSGGSAAVFSLEGWSQVFVELQGEQYDYHSQQVGCEETCDLTRGEVFAEKFPEKMHHSITSLNSSASSCTTGFSCV